MGRDIVLAKIKKGGITAVVGGAVLMLIFGLITIGVMSDNADDGMGTINNIDDRIRIFLDQIIYR